MTAHPGDPDGNGADARQARLAAALRENLRRRKGQARARAHTLVAEDEAPADQGRGGAEDPHPGPKPDAG